MGENKRLKQIRSALLGVAIGDALGVPYEFKARDMIKEEPATEMTGYGTYNMPPGTFSDDASLTFCLAEMLTEGFDLQVLANNFVKWLHEGYWTATGHTFDVGVTTREAISNITRGVKPELAGKTDEHSNGNGSLMRILPLLFYVKDMPVEERFRHVALVSSVTHAHIRSVIACFYYIEFARKILHGIKKQDACKQLKNELPFTLEKMGVELLETIVFERLLQSDISTLAEEEIQSSGYVVHSLEASVWCFLQTENYQDAVLKAVNLGEDTDTTAAITGGLAGLQYGADDIPQDWIKTLARLPDIENLVVRLDNSLSS